MRLIAHALLASAGLMGAAVLSRLLTRSLHRTLTQERRLAELLRIGSDWTWEVDRRGRDIFGRRFRRRRDGFGMMFSRSSVLNVLRGLVAVMVVVILLAMIVMVMMMVVIVVIIVVRVTMIAMVSGFGTLVRLREIMRTVRVAGVVVGLCDLRRLLALGDLDHLALHAFTAAAAA